MSGPTFRSVRRNPGASAQVIKQFPSGLLVPAGWSGIQNPAYPVRYVPGPAVQRFPLSMSARERNHDLSGYCSQWRQLNTSAGVHDATAVARIDTWLNQCEADGIEVIWTVFGTPSWIARTTPNHTDQYGSLYGANVPTDLSSSGCPSVEAHVTWLLNRYNTGGRKRIHYIEAWNEPLYSTAASTYWTGTYQEMAQMTKAVYQAAKAVDPSVIVTSPGFAGMAGGLFPMVRNTLDAPVGDGTLCKEWCDAIAFHPYSLGVARYPLHASHELKQFFIDCELSAPNLPIYNTEVGFLQDWAISQEDRARIIKQHALTLAANGVKMVQWYSADSGVGTGSNIPASYVADNIIGGPLVDPTIRAAFEWVQALGGRTLYEVGYRTGNVMYAVTDQGTVSA